MRKRFFLLIIAALALLLFVPGLLDRREDPQVQAQLVSAAASNPDGFDRVTGPRLLQFPADHGPHPEFQTEWWYYTGNLETSAGRHFGYQLTFFRRGLLPPAQQPERPSDWSTGQIYMAHFALTDVGAERYQAFERLSRGAAGLAGAQASPFQVWLQDWSVQEVSPQVYRMQAAKDGISIDLQLTDSKGPVLQGDQGYSRKGPDIGQASYYYSLTRLVSSGTVKIGAESFTVDGLSWMDHEFSTSYLSKDQLGWDWFALQLDDGSELMVFQLRRADGSVDPFSSGTLVSPDGSTRHLTSKDFELQVEDIWKSPHTRATYPARWTMHIPDAGLTLEIQPYLFDQELNVSYAYWEGAVRVNGEQAGKAVQGSGYVELTGYTGSMGGEF